MKALVYEAPKVMMIRDVPAPAPKTDEALIRVAYSGICGSELSGFEGKNSLRKPPLIMGHEFSGHIESTGERAQAEFPNLIPGLRVTVNPLISCRKCAYCLSGRQQLCPERQLLSAHLPGSYAEYVTVRADAVYPMPEGMPLKTAALAEPAACAVHAARLLAPQPEESALVVGAGPIGLFIIQALADRGMNKVACAELNPERQKMAVASGASIVALGESLKHSFDIAVDAVGLPVTRQACLNAVRSGGRILWIGLHEALTEHDINDIIRREITGMGSFAYTPLDFGAALAALDERRLRLDDSWTRIEPLERGASCFEELLRGSPVAKIWLTTNGELIV